MPHITYEGVEYPISGDENILEGLIQGGAPVLYSCRRGSCRTCTLQTDAQSAELLRNNRLPKNLREAGMFLPCIARCSESLQARRPDWTTCFVEGLVAKKEVLDGDTVRLTLEPPLPFVWHAGQYVELRSPAGDTRPYATASVRASDYYLELLIQRRAGGAVSTWIAEDLRANDIVYFRGALGSTHYSKALHDCDLLLVGNGVSVGSLLAIAREARLNGHSRRVELLWNDGAAPPQNVTSDLARLQSEWPLFSHTPVAPNTIDEATPWSEGRALDATAVFLFGDPRTVERNASIAMQHGCVPSLLFTLVFDDVSPRSGA